MALGLFAVSPLAAEAKPTCARVNPNTGECTIWVDDGSDTEPVKNPGNPGGGDSTKPRKCHYNGNTIPCDSEFGPWLEGPDCYVRAADPQPPKSDPAWGGRDTGAIYVCFNPWEGDASPDPVGGATYIWLPEPPVSVDPEELAHRAIASMGLQAIQVGLSVPDQPDRMIYVGAPVWMWTANPSADTIGPNTASASAGGITVTANARVESIEWTMGDGGRVRCTGEHRARGTVYKKAFGVVESPTCGYRYQQPTEKTTITATSHWVVDWAGGGASGTITLDLARSTTRPVGEVQILVEKDGGSA